MPKRRRLAELAGATPVSAAVLARILDILRDGDDSPAGLSRHAISRAIDADLKVSTPCGMPLPVLRFQTKGSEPFVWEGCHPGARLSLLCHHCGGFDRFLKARLQATPATADNPWHICFYADEATVGNLLSPDHCRNNWLLY